MIDARDSFMKRAFIRMLMILHEPTTEYEQ